MKKTIFKFEDMNLFDYAAQNVMEPGVPGQHYGQHGIMGETQQKDLSAVPRHKKERGRRPRDEHVGRP